MAVDDAIQAVAGVAQTRHDVALIVEAFVHTADDDAERDARVDVLFDELDAFRRGDDADRGHVFCALFGQVVRGGHKRAAGGEHRVDQEALAARKVVRQAVRVGDLLGGMLFVALHAQESDLRAWHHAGHAVEHAQSGAQHRHDDRARLGDRLAHHGGHRRLDRLVHDLKVAGGLVGFERDELRDEFAEDGRRGVFVSQHGELVLDQRVIEYLEFHTS